MASLKKLPKNKAVTAVTSKRVKKAQAEVTAHSLIIQLQALLSTESLPSNAKLLLAFSGGLDSTVLLHLLKEVQRTIPFELHALHVHHGLSPHADAWAEFCINVCQAWHVPMQVVRVNLSQASKESIEAQARRLRYAALSGYQCKESAADFIVTAHHQDDQAETLLLQLLRGAGVKGLASMALIDCNKRLLRPLLNVSRSALLAYAQQHKLNWCEDESNDNTQYARNFIRHEVMPVLLSRYHRVQPVLARVASHLAEADNMLAELAELDAKPLLLHHTLCMQGLAQLSFARAKNVLRWWFSQHQLAMPNTAHLGEILTQLLNANKDANVHIQLQALTLKCYQQRAYLCEASTSVPYHLVWQGETELLLPNGGLLRFEHMMGAGLSLKQGVCKLSITNRKGGEQFKPYALRPTKTLKHLLQEANIPPWQRMRTPLIYWNDTLAFVPNIGVAHTLQAGEGELGVQITWLDNGALND